MDKVARKLTIVMLGLATLAGFAFWIFASPAAVAQDQPFLPTAEVCGPPTIQSAVGRVNVRSGPGVSYDRIGSAAPGDAYEVLDETGGWYAINFNGEKGFVYGTFVTLGQGQPTSAGGGTGAPAAPPVDSLPFTANYALRMRATPDRNAADRIRRRLSPRAGKQGERARARTTRARRRRRDHGHDDDRCDQRAL